MDKQFKKKYLLPITYLDTIKATLAEIFYFFKKSTS